MSIQNEQSLLAQIKDEILKFRDQYSDISSKEPLLSDEMPLRSSELKDLFTALAKAQAEMPVAVKSSMNPYYKSSYASFADIVKASRPCLSKNGIAVLQDIIERDNGQKYLYTMLTHGSGQFKASRIKIAPVKQDVQELGKYITYLKRYAYAALVGVADALEDDDGESEMQAVRTVPQYTGKPLPLPSEETITREQLDLINEQLDGLPEITQLVLDGFKIMTLADIPKQKFNWAIKRIGEIKESRRENDVKPSKKSHQKTN